MATETSPAPWDLASGESWSIRSADHRLADDGNNEVIIDAKGNVVAYVSGNDEGGNGSLLAAAPLMRVALRGIVARHDAAASEQEPGFRCGCMDCATAIAAIKKAGAL